MRKEHQKYSFYEFFAGGGMARAGLGQHWKCLFANDFDPKKGSTYARNWGADALLVADVRDVSTNRLPQTADLVWGSFPCQDLSLAGGGAGLKGDRSGTFWPFMHVVQDLIHVGRAPKVITLENVPGTLTSHGGKDFIAICDALNRLGYRFGALVADASLFVPQSRPRLFIIALHADVECTGVGDGPQHPWSTTALLRAHGQLPHHLARQWIWWQLPKPPKRELKFDDLIEENPKSVKWHTPEETRGLLSMMSEVNLRKVEMAKMAGVRKVGCIYKRTRQHHGNKFQRAEVRFDDIAGCLRTPAGGSSRQLILLVHGNRLRSRLISARETARLMGLPETYHLPSGYNEAYHLTGDGVAVPVVRYLAKHILEPAINAARSSHKVIAA